MLWLHHQMIAFVTLLDSLMATAIGRNFSFNWIIDELEIIEKKNLHHNQNFAMSLCIHFGFSLMWVDWQCSKSHRVDTSCFFFLLKSLNMMSLEVLRERWSYMGFVCFERWLMKWKIELTVCWIMLWVADETDKLVEGRFFVHRTILFQIETC